MKVFQWHGVAKKDCMFDLTDDHICYQFKPSLTPNTSKEVTDAQAN